MIIKRCATKGAYEVISNKPISLDKLKTKFKTIAETPQLIIIQDKFDVTCFKTGKLLIKNCRSEKTAKEIAKKIFTSLS